MRLGVLVWYVNSPRPEGAHILTYVSPPLCTPIPLHQWEWTVFLTEGKHPDTGVKVDYEMIMVCCLTRYILAIPCRQEALTSHKAAALFLQYCVFFTEMPKEMQSDNRSIIS